MSLHNHISPHLDTGTEHDKNTFANSQLVFGPNRMAEDVVQLNDLSRHSSWSSGAGGILGSRISRWWRENTLDLLSAPDHI